MRFAAILNREGGTLRTIDLDAFSERLRATLEDAGHAVDITVVDGKDIEAALGKAASNGNVDVVLAGGGDGTVSAAAGLMMGKKKALAILPAGTMNLFARGLGIPLGLDQAVAAFATGRVQAVDVASANGRPFVHQFSIGLHAKMVHLRDKKQFASRLGKMRASAQAAYATFLNPPSMKVSLTIGDAEIVTRCSGIGVTNNLFAEGTLPIPADPAGGTLGIYVTVAQQKPELARFFVNMARGKWRDNPHVEIHEAEELTLKLLSRRSKRRAVIDGELVGLDRETVVKIHPKALNVLVPAEAPA
jgi:diacylglycerol kinase family enzyme